MSCPKLPNRIGFNFQSPLLTPINLQVQTIILFDDGSSNGVSPTAYHSSYDFGSIHMRPLSVKVSTIHACRCVRIAVACLVKSHEISITISTCFDAHIAIVVSSVEFDVLSEVCR